MNSSNVINARKDRRFSFPSPARMPVRTRLTLLALIVTLPFLVLLAGYSTYRAGQTIRENSQERLDLTSRGLAASVQVWWALNVQTLNELAVLPDIISMEAERQRPVLEAIQSAHPQLYLVHTINLEGFNVARGDGQDNRDYSDRIYYLESIAGKPLTPQIVVGRTSGQPALVLGVPIRNASGEIVGVGSVASNLTDISSQVAVSKIGETGYTYIVDGEGKVVAHPNPDYMAELRDLSAYPPVAFSLGGGQAATSFVDEHGVEWRASVEVLDNGWRVISQQQVAEQERPVRIFQTIAWIANGVAALAIFLLMWLAIRRSLQPIDVLAQAALGFSAGDLDRTVQLERQDEFGVLAEAFNTMAQQLRQTLAGLEQRVAERTRALETSSEVSRQLSTILDPGELAKAVVESIQQAFGYYHAHIYYLDSAGENLVMAGGTGEAGAAMLRSGHKLAMGKGLVGRAAVENRVVLVPDTAADTGWLANPLLSETCAEVAVPITIGTRVLGVLDVQHNVIGGLTDQDANLLQAIASQVAIALQNARQYEESRESQQLLKSVMEGIPNPIFFKDIRGIYTGCNQAFLDYLGKPENELIGKSVFDLNTDRALAEKYHEMDMELFRSPGKQIYEAGVRYADGSLHQVIFNKATLLNPDGDPVGLVGVMVDITERKQAEAALSKSAAELAKVAQVSTAVATIMESGELLQTVVDLTQERFGLYHAHIYLLNETKDELVLSSGSGKVGRQMVAQGWEIPLDREQSLVARAARDRQGVIVNDVRADPGFLPNELLPDTAAELAVPLLASGQLLGVLDVQSDEVGHFTDEDISIQLALASQVAVALQNAQQYEQTRQSEQLVRTIIDATPDWIFIKDEDHRYRLVNQGYAASMGIETKEFIGKNDLELGFPEEIVKGNPEKGIRGFWPDDRQVIESGQVKIIPSEPAVVQGQPRFLNTVKIPLRNEMGKVWGVLGFVRDITEREQLRQETEERLAEVNALYQAMSREAWQDFHMSAERQMAFFFDQREVQPAGEQWREVALQAVTQNAPVHLSLEQPVLATPVKLRGAAIGALAIQADPQRPITEDEKALLEAMSEQIALALESARLFEQTQRSLGETQALYSIIAEMNAANTYADILTALSARTVLRGAQALLLMAVFDRPLAGEARPEWIYPVAHRTSANLEIAQRYPLSAFESRPGTLFTSQAVILKDLATDQRLDKVTRTLFLNVFQASSSIVLPLVLADQAIGFVQGYFDSPVDFSADEVQRLMAVAGQAAIAVQSRLLLEQAQTRARQEQRIREATAQVFSASDVDSIMRRAAEQVSRALGMPAFVYLNPQAGETQQAEEVT